MKLLISRRLADNYYSYTITRSEFVESLISESKAHGIVVEVVVPCTLDDYLEFFGLVACLHPETGHIPGYCHYFVVEDNEATRAQIAKYREIVQVAG